MNAKIQELIVSLQKEYLFIHNEKVDINQLFNDVQVIYDELYKKSYVLNSQQLINLEFNDSTLTEENIKKFFLLESKVNFIKLNSFLNQFEYHIIELFKLMSSDIQCLINILLFCEEKSLNVVKLSNIIYKSILGSAITNSDSDKVLQILINLLNEQFSTAKDPQKLIISGKCSSIRLFKLYIDNLSSAKTFLVATLQEPIEYILMNDDLFLDISYKITKERMFCEISSKYQDKIIEFRKIVVNRIAIAVNMFIKKLTESFSLLPQNYVVIVSNLFKALTENTNLRRIDVLRTCIDFIFDGFIYPAMLNPETYGIIGDFPLSSISKHNLIEIGKIIKSLIYGEINKANNLLLSDTRFIQTLPADLLERFEDYSLNFLIKELSIWSETSMSNIELETNNSINDAMDLNRTLSLISESDMYFLLRSLKSFTMETDTDCTQLTAILARINIFDSDNDLPKSVRNRGSDNSYSSYKEFNSGKHSKTKINSKSEEVDPTSDCPDLNIFVIVIDPYVECPGMKSEEKVISEMKTRSDSMNNSMKNYDKKVLSHNSEIISNSMSSLGHHSSRRDSSSSRSCFSSCETSIHTTSSCRKPKRSIDKIADSNLITDDSPKVNSIDITPNVPHESTRKRTHFTDQELVGPTSDFVDRISEVASTHSVQSEDVDSRFELEDNNEHVRVSSINNSGADTITRTNNYVDIVDNAFNQQSPITIEHAQGSIECTTRSIAGSIIPNSSVTDLEELRAGIGAGIDDGSSDLVYWQNISGRDTPSMSGGRDSPSSSVGGSDLPNNVKPDVTEKFCKFDIPKTVEARSTVSDTWSTDVLASDSETTEQIENRRLVEIQEENHSSNYSQMASENEDNSENAFPTVKAVNTVVPEKLDSVANKSGINEKISTYQGNLRSFSPTSREGSVPSIQLETTLTCNPGYKFKSNTTSRSTARSIRHHGSMQVCTSKEEERHRTQPQTSIESPMSGSPSNARKGLVDKIRDRFSSTKARRDSKDKSESKIDKCDESTSNIKLDQSSPFDLESVEQMLLRYGSKPISKTLDVTSLLNTSTEDESPVPPFYDPKTPPETWPAWKVSKKNLRLILERLYIKTSQEKLLCIGQSNSDKHPLISLLKVCLAEANHLQQDFTITHLDETLRVLQLFDNDSISRMMTSMLKELKKRRVYITYLVNTHTHLRMIKKRAEELLTRCNRTCQVTSRSMISFCVHEILREQNHCFEKFFKKISSKSYDEYNLCSGSLNQESDDSLCSSDVGVSRGQLVADMLDWASRILNNQSYLSSMTNERQLETRIYLERIVMSQLHRFSITLKDDVAELDRDNVFHRELENLQKSISPFQLSINKKFHGLIPFEAAQKELLKINCYKTPQDKVLCIQKTTHKIAILLKMTKPEFIPGADDILPVLIYVIIMANPPQLLSNISYIDTLCADQLEGQNQYMWCQFTAAVNEVRRLLTLQPKGVNKK